MRPGLSLGDSGDARKREPVSLRHLCKLLSCDDASSDVTDVVLSHLGCSMRLAACWRAYSPLGEVPLVTSSAASRPLPAESAGVQVLGGEGMPGAAVRASLLAASDVLGVRDGLEVGYVEAGPVETDVVDIQIVDRWTVGLSPCEAVDEPMLAVEPDRPVPLAILTSGPYEASGVVALTSGQNVCPLTSSCHG